MSYNKVFKHVNPFQKCYIKWDLGQYGCFSDRGEVDGSGHNKSDIINNNNIITMEMDGRWSGGLTRAEQCELLLRKPDLLTHYPSTRVL